MYVKDLLTQVVEDKGSDIFFLAGSPVTEKVDGKMKQITKDKLTPSDTQILIEQIYRIADRSMGNFEELGDDDFSFAIPGLARFRVNAYRQRGSRAAVIRVVAFQIPDYKEKNIPEDYVKVRGAVFNFRNDLLPVEFAVRNPGGMNYFEGVEISPSEPLYTCVWGRINFQTVSTAVTEESAFGEAAVTTRDRKVKEWTITGATRVPHDFGDETVMTAEELTKAMQDRQVLLADIKKQREEYQASKTATAPTAFNTPAAGTAAGAAANAAVKAGGFSF